LPCLNEVLRLHPANKTALYRRSKALSKPINSGVEDLKEAVRDLKAIGSQEVRVLKRIAKLEKKIKHNSKCEHEVYSKMFTRSEKDVMSVTDFVEKSKVVLEPVKSTLDKEIEDEFAKINEEVQRMIAKKAEELSFEVVPQPDRKTYPEFEQLEDLIEQAREGLKLSKKLGKQQEYLLLRGKAKELIFAKEHLFITLNMDLNKPT
jgi:NifB/MoaA-like Fe-S oxidoreductase